MSKLIITAAVTGAFGTKAQNENHPVTPKEIAEEVYRCWQAGAAIAHLHMRKEDQTGSMDLERFEETVKLIRAKGCDIILNLTTSGELGTTEERRMAHLIKLEPEMASYDCGTMNWMHTTIFDNNPKFLEKLGKTMIEHDIKPEIECFDVSMIENAKYYIAKGIIKEPAHFQICLGAPGGLPATVDHLLYMKNNLPKNCTWSAFGIGAGHMPILLATMALGGHIRVGFEDNFYLKKGVKATSNAEFVERTVRVAKEFGVEIATPDEAREMLGITKKV